MRQFLLVASMVGLFIYVGFASQSDLVSAAAVAPGKPETMQGLRTALDATGARMERVLITGWVRVPGPQAQDRVSNTLGWSGNKTPKDETRELKLLDRDGKQYLSLRWVLTGGALREWQTRQAEARKALTQAGANLVFTVQVEGVAGSGDATLLANRALNALGATSRQPWSSAPAASVAGWTAQLPPSAFSVNVQAAVRREAGGRTRVWIAWPALQQEY